MPSTDRPWYVTSDGVDHWDEVVAIVHGDRDPPSTPCTQCGKPLNPVALMLGPVCGDCCRANHRAITRD